MPHFVGQVGRSGRDRSGHYAAVGDRSQERNVVQCSRHLPRLGAKETFVPSKTGLAGGGWRQSSGDWKLRMHSRLRAIFGSLVLALVLLGVVFLLGMRRRSDAVLNAGRRATRVMRPVAMRSAGTEGASASVVTHLGRMTGRSYETPVVAVQHDDGFLIALPYGPRTDWLQNVLAAGSASVRTKGATYVVDRPEVIPMAEATRHFGPKEQRLHRRFGVDSCLWVHQAAS